MTIEPATREQLLQLYTEIPKTVRAFAAVDGDKVLGVAGVYQENGVQVCFAKLTDELRANKRMVVLGMRKVLGLFGSMVFAICDQNEPKAPGLLRHVGFQPIKGEVYIWTA